MPHRGSDDSGSDQQLLVTGDRRDDGTVRVRVSGDLDGFAVPVFRERLAALLAVPVRCVELDLSEVSFCDAAGLRELLALRFRAQLDDIEVVLVSISAPVLLVLRLARADDWLHGGGSPTEV